MNKYLVTGVAGFIGSRVAEMLLENGNEVIGIDNLDPFYDLRLKHYRLNRLKRYGNAFTFKNIDLYEIDKHIEFLDDVEGVFNLAAKAGVRYSIEDPESYYKTNTLGTLKLIKAMLKSKVKFIVHASTSSIYANSSLPFKEENRVDFMISPYAASKKAAEELLYVYHHLEGLNVFVLRYFTVYGPAGRPDMSLFKFTDRVLQGKPIPIYGDGTQERSFTYIDDVAQGTIKAMEILKKKGGYDIINIGSDKKHPLNYAIELIEYYTGKKAQKEFYEFNKADIHATLADITKARRILGWEPKVSLEEGIERLVKWFKEEWYPFLEEKGGGVNGKKE